MATVPKYDRQTVAPQPMRGAFYQPSTSPVEFGGRQGQALGGFAQAADKSLDIVNLRMAQAEFENDRTAAASAYTNAKEQYRQGQITDGYLAKTPAELFKDGRKIEDVYKDAQSSFEKFGQNAGEALQSTRQKQMLGELWGRHGESALGSAANHIASAFKQYKKDTVDAYWQKTDQRLAELSTQVEQDWSQYPGAAQAMKTELDNAMAIGAPADELAKRHKEAARTISAAGVRGWALSQADRYATADALLRGQVSDPEVKKLYDSLDPKTRQQIASGYVTDTSRLATIANSNREMAKEGERKASEQRTKGFFSPQRTAEQRASDLGWAQTDPNVTQPMLEKMQEFQRAGGADFGVDDQRHLDWLFSAIRRGEIKSEDEGRAAWANNNLQLSYETLRTKVFPHIEQRRDAGFKEALDWMNSDLGGISTGMIQLPGDDPLTKKLSRAEASLREFRKNNPTGDYWAEAQKIAERGKKESSAGSMKALPAVVQAYRDALKTGDPKKISSARQALIAVQTESGMVDHLEASRSGYDPLGVIDKPKPK